jgi:hypothetical protein
MSRTVDIEIVPRGAADLALLTDLNGLAEDLAEAELRPVTARARLPGAKADLALAISIAGLALSTVSTVISVLSFWQSKQAQYSVTIKQGDVTYQVSNLGRDEVREIGERIAKAEAGGAVVVGVERK